MLLREKTLLLLLVAYCASHGFRVGGEVGRLRIASKYAAKGPAGS